MEILFLPLIIIIICSVILTVVIAGYFTLKKQSYKPLKKGALTLSVIMFLISAVILISALSAESENDFKVIWLGAVPLFNVVYYLILFLWAGKLERNKGASGFLLYALLVLYTVPVFWMFIDLGSFYNFIYNPYVRLLFE